MANMVNISMLANVSIVSIAVSIAQSTIKPHRAGSVGHSVVLLLIHWLINSFISYYIYIYNYIIIFIFWFVGSRAETIDQLFKSKLISKNFDMQLKVNYLKQKCQIVSGSSFLNFEDLLFWFLCYFKFNIMGFSSVGQTKQQNSNSRLFPWENKGIT